MNTMPASIELLEPRIAPATLINPTTLTFQDIDGDKVTLKISQPLFTSANVVAAFTFSTGGFGDLNAAGQALLGIDLSKFANLANGLNISITAVRDKVHGGNGEVDVNYIHGFGHDLGKIKVAGDLGGIQAGDGDLTIPGVKTLDVLSLGERYEFASTVQGLGTLKIRGDLRGQFTVVGKLASATIGGSVTSSSVTNSGIFAGEIGTLIIGGSIDGTFGVKSGQVSSLTSIAKIVVRGSLLGGGAQTGLIQAGGDIHYVEVDGSLSGGPGSQTGSIISTGGSILTAIVKGSLRGGSGADSGSILAQGGMGKVTVGRDVLGGTAGQAGSIIATTGKIDSIVVRGSVFGGNAPLAGEITTTLNSGKDIGSVTIGGDLIGGTVSNTGDVASNGKLGSITIGGSLIGGEADYSGRIVSQSDLGKVRIGGSLSGKAFNGSGVIFAVNSIGSVRIARDMAGIQYTDFGNTLHGFLSGSIYTGGLFGGTAAGTIGSVVIGGDLISANIAAGIDPGADRIFGNADDKVLPGNISSIGSIVIKGHATGQGGDQVSFGIEAHSIKSLKVGGRSYLHTDSTISYSTGFGTGSDSTLLVRER